MLKAKEKATSFNYPSLSPPNTEKHTTIDT